MKRKVNSTLLDQYQGLLDGYNQICKYAVDLNVISKPAIAAPFSVGVDEFYKTIYQVRAQEEVIRNSLFKSSDIVVLVGEKGAGKTSLGKKIIRDFQNQPERKTLVIEYDIRMEGFKAKPIHEVSPAETNSSILGVLKEKYLKNVFPFEDISVNNNESKKINPFLKLVAFLVDPSEPKDDNFLHASKALAAQLQYGRYISINSERKTLTYYDWLMKARYSNDRVMEIIEDVPNWLKVSTLMHAAHAIFGYEKQCIFIDNVDRLSYEQQTSVQNVVKGLYTSISQIANIILAVRERNIYKEYAFDEFQAPPFKTFVKLYNDTRSEVPAYEMQQLTHKELRQIIGKRLKFAQARINSLISSAKNQNSPVKYTNDELKRLGPSISTEVFKNVSILSNKILNGWNNIRAPQFGNNSIRLLLDLHSSFLEYFINSTIENRKKERRENPQLSIVPKFSEFSEREVLTLFLSWVRRNRELAENSQIKMHDVIAFKDSWIKNGRSLIGCNIQQKLLVVTWNLTLKQSMFDAGSGNVPKQSFKIPKVRQVLEPLIELGFDKAELKKNIFDLYREEETRTHFLEIQPTISTSIKDPNGIQDDYLISITPRGKSFVRYISNTFGYLLECAITSNALHEGLPEKDQYMRSIAKDEEAGLDLLLPHLYDIASMHLTSIGQILNKTNLGEQANWFENYLEKFGVPADNSNNLPRAERDLGLYINGFRRATHIELLLSQLFRYAQKVNNRKKLTELSRKYYSALEDIKTNGTIGDRQFVDLKNQNS